MKLIYLKNNMNIKRNMRNNKKVFIKIKIKMKSIID